MNSLEELNGNSVIEQTYTDYRVADVFFNLELAENQSVTLSPGEDHDVPVGIEIIDIANYETCLPTFTIDIQGVTGATIDFGTLPSRLTLTNTTPGLYVISGLGSVDDWDAIKSPTVSIPIAFEGYFTYNCSIDYTNVDGSQSQSYIVACYVGTVSELSDPLDHYYAALATETITNNPVLTTLSSPATFTVTITPNVVAYVTSISTSGTGGTSSVNPATKVVTLTGTYTQVNSHLNNISITFADIDNDFTLTYYATNDFNAQTDTKVQQLRSEAVEFLDYTTTIYYNEDSPFYLTGYSEITDTNFADTTGYTLTITPSDVNAIDTMTGSGTFNNTTKVFTLTGTRTAINAALPGIGITPGSDYDQNFTFTYAVTTPRSDTASKIQDLLIGVADTDATNLNINRSYLENQGNLIFASNTPQIADVTPGATYSVILSCGFGTFGIGTSTAPVNNYSISGTKSQINAKLATVKFYPNAGVNANGYMLWTQFKNGVLSVQQNIALFGTAQNYAGNRTLTFNSSGTFTPTFEDVLYAKVTYLAVIGGGGGGAHGGGAGGQVVQATNITLSQQTYNIVVGAGGTASTNWNYLGSNGNDGTASSAFGVTAGGGTGGTVPQSPLFDETPADGGDNSSFQGGNGKAVLYSTSTTTYSDGGTIFNNYWMAGGGGAGAGGVGISASQQGSYTTSWGWGHGGPGVTLTYFGGTYAWGGGGATQMTTFSGRGGVGSKTGGTDHDVTLGPRTSDYYNGGLSLGSSVTSVTSPYTWDGAASNAGTNTGAGGGGGTYNSGTGFLTTERYFNNGSPSIFNTYAAQLNTFKPPTNGADGKVLVRIEGI